MEYQFGKIKLRLLDNLISNLNRYKYLYSLETWNVVSESSYMKEYILNLEKEFSLIENGFKEEEKRALADYLSNDNAYTKD